MRPSDLGPDPLGGEDILTFRVPFRTGVVLVGKSIRHTLSIRWTKYEAQCEYILVWVLAVGYELFSGLYLSEFLAAIPLFYQV